MDERTAREIENEKPAVRERYEGTPQWMKAPNGKDTNLTVEQWLAARTKAFKKRFGNWEAAAIKKELISGKAVAVDDKKDYSDIIPHDVMAGYARRKPDETNRLIKILSDILPKEIKNTPIGDVGISGNSIRNDVHHSRSHGKIIALFYIEELLQKAQYIGHREEGTKTSHVLAVPVTVSNGQRLIVTMVVHETRDGKKFYNHEFTKIKTLDAAATVAPRKTGRLAGNRPQHQAVNDILSEEVWNVNDVSIAVDENGEPIFSDIPDKPETGGKPKTNQEQPNTEQVQSRSEKQGGFSYAQSVLMQAYNQSAWHGSPHTFEKFDLGAIGTGEGAQAHGWGLYFAKDRKVSEGYKKRLGGNDKIQFAGNTYEKVDDNEWRCVDGVLDGESFLPSDAIFKILNVIEQYTDKSSQEIDKEKILSALEEMYQKADKQKGRAVKDEARQINQAIGVIYNGGGKYIKGDGSLFQVEIPDDDVLLDEQKTFSEQSEKVKEALMPILESKEFQDVATGGIAKMPPIGELTGRTIYNVLSKQIGGSIKNGQRAASEYLNSIGIKGITYEGGRDGRCFVVFDDQAISVIETYNQQMNGGKVTRGRIWRDRKQGKLLNLLNASELDLNEASRSLSESKKELATLKAQLETLQAETKTLSESLKIANEELAKASASFKASERERDKIENRLRTQRNVWEALFAVAVGVAVAK